MTYVTSAALGRIDNGHGWFRSSDLRVFSTALYQLSYMAFIDTRFNNLWDRTRTCNLGHVKR